MNTRKDGGPAFPTSELLHTHGMESRHISGMTLRDYFAAAALQGYLAAGNVGGWTKNSAAEHAYLWADAMLAERDK